MRSNRLIVRGAQLAFDIPLPGPRVRIIIPRRCTLPLPTILKNQCSLCFSSISPPKLCAAEISDSFSRFAVVDHSGAYEMQLSGRHGQQLSLARLYGIGKDDPSFDPFLEDELIESQKAMEEINRTDKLRAEDQDDDDDDDDGEIDLHNRDGSVRWSKAERSVFQAGAPAGGVFAIIELAGSQFKITTDDLLIANLLPAPFNRVGTTHSIDSVLLVGCSHKTFVGMPSVLGASVTVMVEEITKDEKVIVFRKRRRKNWKRKTGFRRDITMLRVLAIDFPRDYTNSYYVERMTPKVLLQNERSEQSS